MVQRSVCYQLRVHGRVGGWFLLVMGPSQCCSSAWSGVFVVVGGVLGGPLVQTGVFFGGVALVHGVF